MSSLPFPPLRDSSGLLAPNKHLARLLSIFFLYAPSPPVSVYSAESPPVSGPPHRPPPIVRLSESYQPSGFGRPMSSSGFRPIVPYAGLHPPPTCEAGGTCLGCGWGGEGDGAPAVVLSLSGVGMHLAASR